MRHGFIKTAAGTPKIQVADCVYNAGEILKLIRQMENEGAKIMAFPELCITGYTCQDLFWQTLLLDSAREQLIWLAKETSQVDALIIVGLPWEYNGKLYNVAAVLNRGTILGLVPKTNLPNYAEYYEARHFTPADQDSHMVGSTIWNKTSVFLPADDRNESGCGDLRGSLGTESAERGSCTGRCECDHQPVSRG